MMRFDSAADALDYLADARPLLVAMDFDGTLAGFSTEPLSVRAVPGAMEAMLELAGLPDTTAMLVSGRNIAQLTVISEQDEDSPIVLVGSHGAEPASAGQLHLTDGQRWLWDRLFGVATELAKEVEGVWVEEKPLSVSLHIRAVPERDAALELQQRYRTFAEQLAAGEIAGESVPSDARLKITEGKDILEIAVVDSTKGSFIESYRAEHTPAAVLFAGDDTTDETVFRVLTEGDVGIHVGSAEGVAGDDTAADYGLPDPESVRDFLVELAARRCDRVAGN